MSVEERIIKLEEFAADVRGYTKILTDMMRRYDERLDEHGAHISDHDAQMTELRAAGVNADARIAALADAQIQTEAALANLSQQVSALTEAQAHSDVKLDALIDIVSGNNGKGNG